MSKVPQGLSQGYIINPMPTQIDPEMIAGLLETDTGTIGHFLDAGCADPGITSKMPGAKIAGTAVTVRLTVPDSLLAHYALKFIRPGDVLIIDRGQDQRTACWGKATIYGAAAAGLTGLIMDGVGNDFADAIDVGLPIWCRGVSPVTTKYRGLGGEMNIPINCGGAAVSPGDAVLADDNGVFFMNPSLLPDYIRKARIFMDAENTFLQKQKENPHLRYPDLTGASEIVERLIMEQKARA